MENFVSISQLAELFGVYPKDVSDLFCFGKVSSDTVVVFARRRLIPKALIPTIATALQSKRVKRRQQMRQQLLALERETVTA